MGEEKGKLESIREWIAEHKLRIFAVLYGSGIVASMAYNWPQRNLKISGRIVYAGVQALTLVGLSDAATFEYLFHKSGAKVERVAKFLEHND